MPAAPATKTAAVSRQENLIKPEIQIGVQRPSQATTYSREISDRILDRMAEGESLRTICREDAMPNRSTVLRWARDDRK